MPVVTEEYSDTIPQIVHRLAAAQKSNRGAPAYSRWVNRPAGRLLAACAYKLGMSPNQVTLCSALLSLAGIVTLVLARPSWLSGIIVAALLATGYACDSSDGQLARLQGGGNPTGEWLDHVVDSAKTTGLHLAVLVSWYRYFDLSHPSMLLVPVVFCLAASVGFFVFVLTEQLHRQGGERVGTQTPRDASAPVLRSLVKLPTDYGLLCVTFILLGQQAWFTVAYTVMMLVSVLALFATLAKSYGSLREVS